MSDARPLAVLGGTFDPIHYGHLRTALELYEGLDLCELRLIPAGQPPHRQAPSASAAQRLDMVQLAVEDDPILDWDDRECHRRGPSYTVDTLADLRAELGPQQSVVLVLGADAFAHLHAWERWQQLLELAHIVVVHRPGTPLPDQGQAAKLLTQCGVESPAALADCPAGHILPWPVTPLDISSSRIREHIAAGGSARYLVPNPVWRYICSHGLYQARPTADPNSYR